MKNLNSKSADIVKGIACELLLCDVGERIPTTTYFAKKFSVGLGTVEKVLNALKEREVIKLQSRGQMGTVLLDKNIVELWKVTEMGPLIGLLPLPNTREYEGLATGFTEVLSERGVNFSLNFKNGGKERVKSLLDSRADFVVLSNSAAENVLKEHDNLLLVTTLSNHTYYSDLVVMYRKGLQNAKESWRLGVDETSYDHVFFTGEHFKQNEIIHVHYVNIPYFIADGKIDAAVWHNKSLIPLDLIEYLDMEPLNDAVLAGRIGDASATSVITRKDNMEVCVLLRELFDVNRIEEIQREVVNRKRIPTY